MLLFWGWVFCLFVFVCLLFVWVVVGFFGGRFFVVVVFLFVFLFFFLGGGGSEVLFVHISVKGHMVKDT